MTTDIKSRETILNYVAGVIKYAFVRPLKRSRMKMDLTFASVKWILRKCGDKQYMFDERDFAQILSKAGFTGGFVSPNYDVLFIIAHVSMCKILPVEIANMVLAFIPGTWNDKTQDDLECRYCVNTFQSAHKLQTHLRTYAHQQRYRQMAIPTYMKGKLNLSREIEWINPLLRSGLIFKYRSSSYSRILKKRSQETPLRSMSLQKIHRGSDNYS